MNSLVKPIYAAITNPALTDPSSPSSPDYVNHVLQNVFSIFMIVGVIYFLWHFVFAGYHWISSNGEAKKIEDSRNEVIYAATGLAVVFVVFAVLKFIGVILGIRGLDNLQFTLPSL